MMSTLFPPSRDAALDRLVAFLPRAGRHYAAQRNHDLGPTERTNVSLLSPYVRHRLLSEQEIVAAVFEQHSPAVAEKFIQEVVWRTYWKGWLEHRPGLWDRYLDDVATLSRAASPTLRERLDAATAGQTGIACFDAWARELAETGYLHNHTRMWFASIWIFTLKLPWQLGADFFMRHLLDGDAASNTLSWRWVGGLHTQGKTYLARPDNIASFTNARFDPQESLATVAPALPADDLPPRTPLIERPTVAPTGPLALIITEDDLGVETWPIGWDKVTTVLLLDCAASYPGVAGAVAAFKRAALADTATRLRPRVARDVPILTCNTTEMTSALQAIPKDTSVVMYDAPVGPCRTAFAPVRLAMEQGGRPLHRLRRDWDAAFWPHATAGFFKVKHQIPAVLRSLGMAA